MKKFFIVALSKRFVSPKLYILCKSYKSTMVMAGFIFDNCDFGLHSCTMLKIIVLLKCTQ